MIKPTLCIFHFNCADGFSAAWAVWKKIGDSVQYHGGIHGEAPPDVTGHDVVIVDFSYKRPVMEEIIAKARSVTVLDHHKSAIADLQPLYDAGLIHGVFDLNRSGAMITWNYFHPDTPAPKLLEVVQDRDLWRFEIPGTEDIQAALFSYEYTFENWDRLMMAGDLEVLRREGQVLTRKHLKDVHEIIDMTMRTMTIAGYKVPVANFPYTMASDAGNIMASKYDAPFAATYYDRAGSRRFSLRSVGDFDVSEIAKKYQGGGHKNAAGFEVALGWEGEKAA